MNTYEVSYYKKGWGGARKMNVEAAYPSEAEELVENMVGSGCSILTTFQKKQPKQTFSDSSSSSGGTPLLIGGFIALYLAALYAPFVCAGGSAILAGKYIKTRWHWKTFWILLFALVGFLGGDVIKQKAGLGEYQNNPAKMNIVEEVVDTIFTQPIRNSYPHS